MLMFLSLSFIIDWVAKKIFVLSPLVSEVLAVRVEFLHGFKDISICSDFKTVISLASSDHEPPWEIGVIINNVISMAGEHGFLFFFILQSSNGVARWIVRESCLVFLPLNRTHVLMSPLVSLLAGLAFL